jgi:hypothetical protein
MKQFFAKHNFIGLLLVFAVIAITNVCLAALVPLGAIYGVGTVVPGGQITQQGVTGGDTPSETTMYMDMPDVERKVWEYKQYQTPLLTLLSNQGGDSVESWEAKYYAVDSRGMDTTIASASTLSDGYTTLTVSDSSIFTKFNTIYVPALAGAAFVNAGVSLVGVITAFPETNKVTIKILNPANALVAADFAAKKIYRGGSAHTETAASTTPWGVIPETDYNYVQIFMEQVEQSEYQKLMKKEADWGFNDLKRLAIEDFKIQRERTFLNGLRSATNITVDGQTKRFYTCGGLLNDVGIPVNSSFDLSAFVATPNLIVPVIKSLFTGNNGSKVRFGMLGADFVEAVEQANFTSKHILAKETETIMGIRCTKIVSTFGEVNLFYYEQLDLLGKEKTAVFIDRPNIFIKDLKGKSFNVRSIDYKSTGVASVDAAVIEQASTMLIKNKSTHLIINAVS